MSLIDKYTGSLLGLAVCDALGTTLEFKPPGSFTPITDIVGGGPFCLNPGEWTDDTSMALCLADSLIDQQGFDASDQMRRYLRWYQEGYMSSTGDCFDIGNTVSASLERFASTRHAYSGSTDPKTAGNGSLMRLCPIPLANSNTFEKTVYYAAESSKTTHAASEAVDACRYYSALIHGALLGVSKDTLLSPNYSPITGYWDDNPLEPNIADIADGSYKTKSPPEIQGTGYVVKSMEAALWAFHNSDNFRDGAMLAVNLGDDADTTGAIYGQLAGAFYGVDSIPLKWRDVIKDNEMIMNFASKLHQLSLRLN